MIVRKSAPRLYAPFLALFVLQAAFVVVAPRDRAPSPSSEVATSLNRPSAEHEPATADQTSVGTIGDGQGGATTQGGAARSPSAAPTETAQAARSAGGPTVAARPFGDTSHCIGGRQTDIVYNAPPCLPRFMGDNGGATYPGVTAKEIRVVAFECQNDEQVGALLATQGLVSTGEQRDAMLAAAVRFINTRYETYGRTLVVERIVGDCPTSPPDPVRARQAALEVAKTKPMFVYLAGGDVAAADAFAQNGIISAGVLWNTTEIYAGRRPFRWDVFPTANETAAWTAEYFCKKLARAGASHAGRVIHPAIGGRTTARRLGVIVPDDGTGGVVPAARSLVRAAEECGGAAVPLFTYQSDISRATEQSRAVVAGLIEQGVTTVACMCDAIAPVFFTQDMTRSSYYPEHLLTGMGLMDDDSLARLYDPAQWRHAFGLSHLTEPVPLEESDAAKIWRAAGNEGNPCAACTYMAHYLLLIGSMVHLAGPDLTPATVERGLVTDRYRRGGWTETGGDPRVYLTAFGPSDYNAISDVREVYWDPGRRSAGDGRTGGYTSVAKGRRYASGEIQPGLEVPATTS